MIRTRSLAWVLKRFFGYLGATVAGALVTLWLFDVAYPAHIAQRIHFYEMWSAAPSYTEFVATVERCGTKDVLAFRLSLLGMIYTLMLARFIRT